MPAVASNVLPSVYGPANSQGGRQVIPVGAESDWQEANLDPTTFNGPSNGADAIAIYTVLADGGADIVPIIIASGATGIDLACEYKANGTLTSGPVIQVVCLDRNGRAWEAVDADGNVNWTLATAATDLDRSAALGMTRPKRIADLGNPYRILVLVKTAAVGSGFSKANGGRILAKLI